MLTELDLQQVTVIIPTYQRPIFLRRNLKFWSMTNASIIVADGSPTSELSHLENEIKIDYFRSSDSMELRLAEAAARTKTNYAIITGDDEIMLPESLAILQKFLDNNSDHISCIGRCVSFEKKDIPKSNSSYLLLRPDKIGQATHQVNQISPTERMIYHISNYQVSTFYSLHSTSYLRSILERISSNRISSPYGAELLFEIAAAEAGKSSVLSVPSWLRSNEKVPVRSLIGDVSLAEWKKHHSNEIRNCVRGMFGKNRCIEDTAMQLINEQIEKNISNGSFSRKVISSFSHMRDFFHYRRRALIEHVLGWSLAKNFSVISNVILRELSKHQISYFVSPSRNSFVGLENADIELTQDVGLSRALEFIASYSQEGETLRPTDA